MQAKIGIVMGSQSDWAIMKKAADILSQFDLCYESNIVSAHRTPERLAEYGKTAQVRGLHAIIAGAGGAAHLPGMMAAHTPLPVLGVPIPLTQLNGLDSLLSIVQMPKGVPVATFAIGESGAINAALFAVSLLALQDVQLAERYALYRQKQTDAVLSQPTPKDLL